MKKLFILMAVAFTAFAVISCDKNKGEEVNEKFYGMWAFDQQAPVDFEFETKEGKIVIPDSLTGEGDQVVTDADMKEMFDSMFPADELKENVRIELKKIQEENLNTQVIPYMKDDLGNFIPDDMEGEEIKGKYAGDEIRFRVSFGDLPAMSSSSRWMKKIRSIRSSAYLEIGMTVRFENDHQMSASFELKHLKELLPNILLMLQGDPELEEIADLINTTVNDMKTFCFQFNFDRVK